MRIFTAIKSHLGWYGIAMLPTSTVMVAASYTKGGIPLWGAILLVLAAYCFCWSEQSQRKREAWERAEYMKVKEENRNLRDQLKRTCRDLSRLA